MARLLHLHLLRLAPEHHMLLVNMHHIICDGVSTGILMRDVFAIYEGLLQHRPAKLPELPIQFADYAVWLEDWRTGAEAAAAGEFWRERLQTGLSPLHVPQDAGAAAELPAHLSASTGAIETALVPSYIAEQARTLSDREGVTQHVFFLSAFLVWLYRLTRQDDLTVGYPVANRDERTQDVIGLFTTIQPLRVDMREHPTFRDLLQHVQRWTMDASSHQMYSFENLVSDSALAEGKRALDTSRLLHVPAILHAGCAIGHTARYAARPGAAVREPRRGSLSCSWP